MANDDLSGRSAGLVVFAVQVLPRQSGTWQSFAPVFTPVKKGRIPAIKRRIPAVGQKADPAHRRRDGMRCSPGGTGFAAGPIVPQDFPSAFFVSLLLLLPVCGQLTQHGHGHQVDGPAVLPRTIVKINDAADFLMCIGHGASIGMFSLRYPLGSWRSAL